MSQKNKDIIRAKKKGETKSNKKPNKKGKNAIKR
jgi:hypothetical protein